MTYCKDRSKAILTYEFPAHKKDIYVSNNPPIDVLIEQQTGQYQSLSQSYSFTFDGGQLTSYRYNCKAPDSVPRNATCYITSGSWDDYGTIGSYSSPTIYGQINSFSGDPVSIGEGLQISGSVINTIRPNCSATLTLEWRWGGWAIKVLKDDQVIFEDIGNNKPLFNVACDNDCPPGYCKCDCVNYPGYCCYDNNGNPLR